MGMFPDFRNRSLCRNTQSVPKRKKKKKKVLCLIQIFLPTFLHTVSKHQVQPELAIFQVIASYSYAIPNHIIP